MLPTSSLSERRQSGNQKHSDVQFRVAPLRDAIRERHGLVGSSLLGASHGTISISAGTIERTGLERRAVGVQKARETGSNALLLSAAARLLAGGAMAAQMWSGQHGSCNVAF